MAGNFIALCNENEEAPLVVIDCHLPRLPHCSPRPHRGCWAAGSDLGRLWPSRLVATAESEDSLIPLANRERRNAASGYFVHEPEQISLTSIWRRRRALLGTSTKEYRYREWRSGRETLVVAPYFAT